MQTWTYVVTFERPEAWAPKSFKGTVESSSFAGAAARAARVATRDAKSRATGPLRPESMLVLIERPVKSKQDRESSH